MKYEAFRRRLQEVCFDPIEMYHRRYLAKPPLGENVESELTESLASKTDIYACFDAPTPTGVTVPVPFR